MIRVSQKAVEVLHGGNVSVSRVSQKAVEVLHSINPFVQTYSRVSQKAVEVLHSLDAAPDCEDGP